jgi:predicted transposase/invertase (TIGR01784 family)
MQKDENNGKNHDLETNTNRNYKDSVFTKIFNNEEKARELYNAIKGTNYDSKVKIEMRTLKDTLFLERINDIAFTIEDKFVVLVEHQSSVSENLPLRFLMYIGRVYDKMIVGPDVYKNKLLKVPTPEFIVLYNGDQKFPEEKTLNLSDAFKDKSAVNLELTVKVLNINKGCNENMVKRSETLHGYSELVARVKEYLKTMELGEALKRAVKNCINEGILVEFLRDHGSEVISMLNTEFKIDDAKKVWQKEARQEGEARGLRKGKLETAINMIRRGTPTQVIAEITGLDSAEIEELRRN